MRVFLHLIALTAIIQSAVSQAREWDIKDVLENLEKNSEYRFSYKGDIISQQKILIDSSLFSTPGEVVKYLERSLLLKFDSIQENYLVIREYQNGDQINICATVLDERGRPVIGAMVIGDNSAFNAVTDDRGQFFLEKVPYNTSFTLRHITYNSRRTTALDLIDPDCSSLTMFESIDFLKTLTVKDYLTVGIIKERNEIKLYPSEIKIIPGHTEPDIMQSIQLAPGVNSPYETAAGIHVRGGSPDQNLVMWNGIRTYNQGHFFGMLSAFNPYITDEVTFIKSGTNAKYGERVSSVIDISTSKEIPLESTGGFGLNLMHADAYIHHPVIKDKASILLSGRRSFNDFVETMTFERYADRVFQNTKIAESVSNEQASNRFFFNDFSSSVNIKTGENHLLRFSNLYDNNSLNFVTQNDSSGTQYNDALNTKNEGYNLSFSKDIQDGLNYEFEAYYSKYLLSYAFMAEENDTTDMASKKNLVNDYGIRTSTSFPIDQKQTIAGGYEYSLKKISYSFENETTTYSLILDVANISLQNHAFFGEYTIEYGENSLLQVGSRLNYYQEPNQWFLEPRLYLEQSIFKGTSLTASAEYRSQGVSQIRESIVSDLSLENKVWTLASPEGFPITTSYQLGGGLFHESNGFYAEAEAYYRDISGITTLTFGFLNPLGNEFLIGQSQIRGFDLFLKKQLTGYKSWLSYSYINSQNEFAGLNNNEPFPGNWNIEHTVKWSHFVTMNRFQLSLAWLWHTGKAYTEVVEAMDEQGPVVIAYEGINTQNLPVYHRLDASFVYELQSKMSSLRYRFGVSVLNVYNRKNQLNREFRTTPSLDNDLIETDVFGLGIIPNIVFRVFW